MLVALLQLTFSELFWHNVFVDIAYLIKNRVSTNIRMYEITFEINPGRGQLRPRVSHTVDHTEIPDIPPPVHPPSPLDLVCVPKSHGATGSGCWREARGCVVGVCLSAGTRVDVSWHLEQNEDIRRLLLQIDIRR